MERQPEVDRGPPTRREAVTHMANERATDQHVRDLLREIDVKRPWEQDGGPQWKRKALAGGTKSSAGRAEGKPEFVFVQNDFVVVIEDKKNVSDTRYLDGGAVVTDHPYRLRYALNGAVHYAQTMLGNGIPYDRGIFAVGIGGDEQRNEISVAYVAPGFVKVLPDLDNLEVFAADQIDEYHGVAVEGRKSRAETELADVKAAAETLHEGMRNYGSVENDRKASLVSAILLALKKPGFTVKNLEGLYDEDYPDDWDGKRIYDAAEAYMRSQGFGPQQKIGTLLDQFAFIAKSPALNRVRSEDIGMSTLRWCAQILDEKVLHVVSNPEMMAFDVLGNFYHEFISYNGAGDGAGLGIVLTPDHVTTLMAELIDIGPDDYVLDPCAGTASFLIAAMQRMFAAAGDDEKLREDIRARRLHGIELQDKLFAIGTTNMILRGDGKANFRRDSIFEVPMDVMRKDHGFTKVLLNPPYSQAKNASTEHLSELAFITRAMEFLNPGGKIAVIVPQSTMVGKTKKDKDRKKALLAKHTLEAVITMNGATFYNSGASTHVVVALFTAGIPHPADKIVRFVNFENDGHKVAQHRGLVDDGTAASRRKHLLAVLRGEATDTTKFVVRTTVTAEDEWQHSYFYFNDEPPTYDDFMKTVADYLTWQVDMHAHGRGDLITPVLEDEGVVA